MMGNLSKGHNDKLLISGTALHTKIYFRDMIDLWKSLKDLLRPDFIESYNSYKKGRSEKQNHKPISFSYRQLPTLPPQKNKHSALQTIFTKI